MERAPKRTKPFDDGSSPTERVAPENAQRADALAVDGPLAWCSIGLVLEKVFQSLPTNDLLRYRLICKQWNKEANKVLLKGCRVNIVVSEVSSNDSVVVGSGDKKLPDLILCIRESSCFPCSDVSVFAGNLGNPHLWRLFRLQGQRLKRLVIVLSASAKNGGMKIWRLRELLLRLAPNLQQLEIDVEEGQCFENGGLFIEPAVLPNMQNIKFGKYFAASEQIVRACPNLLQVECGLESAYKVLVPLDKCKLLKEMHVDGSSTTLHMLEKLGKVDLKLKYIHIDLVSELPEDSMKIQVEKSIKCIMESSRESCEKLHVKFAGNRVVVQNGWPVCTGLRQLELCYTEATRFVLPYNYVKNAFPNMETIILRGPFVSNLNSLFSSSVSFDKVKNLMIYPSTNVSASRENYKWLAGFEVLKKVIPRFKFLKVNAIQDLRGISNAMWALSSLKIMKLELLVADGDKGNLFPFLDMAFTGLPEITVRKLREDQSYLKRVKNNQEEICRQSRSLLDMKGLERLQLIFSYQAKSSGPCDVISAVVGELCFKIMNKLEVEVYVGSNTDVVESVSCLKPFVKFVKINVS